MRKSLPFCLCLLAFACAVWAQPLRSVGPIPPDLKMSVQQLYDADMERAEQYAGGRVRDKEAIMRASYRTAKMLAGGHIVYGDPITNFVNSIADTLLQGYPELRSELRFYTVTSPNVNAFTTPQGMIFVTTGLVAQVENEAQLAFIIAHEIIHYYRAHGLETLVGGKKRGSDLDDEAEHAGDFLRRHNRSHAMESEADSLGITLFYLSSPYWKGVAEGVFDVLQYSELPFDDVPFDTTFFNTPYYRLTGCWLDSVADITSRDNYDDKNSSHPNILKRRQLAAAILAGHSGGRKYVTVSQQEFERLRHLARVECIRQDLLCGRFPQAFYNSWLLLASTPNDATLSRYLAQALYGVAVFKCNERDDVTLPDPEQIEGESQQVYHAFRQMNAEQATLAAIHKCWELHLRHQHGGYTAMCDHLMELLRTKCKKSAPDYINTPPVAMGTPQPAPDTLQPAPETSQPVTKYERIKQKRQNQTRQNPTAYALTDLMMADSSLATTLKAHLDGTTYDDYKPQPSQDDAMLVFNPSYWVENAKEELNATKSNAREDDLVSRIAGTAKRLGVRTVDFSDQAMHSMTDDRQYNDFLTLCEWMNEFWLTRGSFELQRLMQPDMDRLLEHYDARTLNMTAVLNCNGQHGMVPMAYAIAVPLLPVVVASALTGQERTAMVSIVVDAHEGKVISRQAYDYRVADHNALVDAMLYDTYLRATRTSSRQPVGHAGHRMALAGGANLGIAGRQNFSYNQYLALTPWASAEFALSRKLSLAVSARYQKANPDIMQDYSGYYNFEVEQNGHTYSSTQYIDSVVPSSRNMLTLALELRNYHNSDFAPYGPYFDIGAHMVRCALPGKPIVTNTFGIHLGIGRNYILLRRLLLNYQIDYGYTYGFKNDFFGFDDETRPYHHYGDAILSNLITLKLGIGIIPF